MKIHLESVKSIAAKRSPELFEEAKRSSVPLGKHGFVEVDDSLWHSLLDRFPVKIALGDVVERIAHPIAKAINLPCLDKETNQLKPTSPCAKRRDWLNRLAGHKKP